ncbi:flagellar hook-associated protein 1 FlgK [Methylophilus rhizosphaerae]|uniref:Flagellar hook-associated protein 1 n=1 Tax=Methylophilus rhizosphaerae TaxID=492660 RepID=A0A1G8ZBR8_9PROT|nr:flagellar hook-associated protein FlgK [Methylophilus rhizosphaerae]SDK12521.1 flagellar hook-associated protein 1 FlgK [Methylophilus rhizosphaerae]
MSSIFNIGKSALTAAQIGITTTGHNIANASTPGYNRQVIVQSAAQAQNWGYGYIGQGTNVSSITRVYNDTLAKQMLSATSSSGASGAYYSNISDINSLLSDSSAGLGPVMTQFFSAVSAAAANPGDIATRQTVLSSANSLLGRFGAVNDRLNDIRQSLNTQISTSVDNINSYATQISQLNAAIDKARSTSGNPPNDLMDQRDLLVSQLSQEIKTTVVQQDDGSYNILIGNGMPLVVGKETYQLTTQPNPTDPGRLEVAYGNNNPKIITGSTLAGGTLGGIIAFRSETLDPVQNQIGQLAITLATQFNEQQQNGYDLNGDDGVAMFNIPQPVVTSSAYNTDPSKQATATFVAGQSSQLTSSDYTLKYTNGQYNIIRNSDKTVTPVTTLPITVDGIEFNVNTSTPAEGDEYLIRPTQAAAGKITLALDNPEKLALAERIDKDGNLVAFKGPGDNGNGLKLAQLQDNGGVRLMGSNSTRSYTQAFALMVSAVGTKTNEMMITSKADAASLEAANSAMQSESGVNLDEEAANLLRYQQAYQAAGKMMQIASQMFDVLMQLGQ